MLKVGKIENGVVIDHIPEGKVLKCLALMGGFRDGESTIVAMNVPSTKRGKKDILKIENFLPTDETINRLALIAPEATINIVKNFEISDKRKVTYPKEISGIVQCINPKCATRLESYLTPHFLVESINPLRLKCTYCERSIKEDNIMNQLK